MVSVFSLHSLFPLVLIFLFRKCSDSSAASVATLSCDDEVLSLDGLVADDDDVRVAALSQEGNLLLYQFTSTTLVQSPVTTTTTLSFVSQPVKVSSLLSVSTGM